MYTCVHAIQIIGRRRRFYIFIIFIYLYVRVYLFIFCQIPSVDR